MKCQQCKKRRATVHITDVSSGTGNELHLCDECAQKEGVTLKSNVSLADFLAGLIKAPVTKEMARLAKLKCPDCGISYLEFQSKGRLGCPRDYEVFAELISPLLDKIHGSTRHTGKWAAPQGPVADSAALLQAKRNKLKAAVDDENYEDAARLRDEIRRMEESESES